MAPRAPLAKSRPWRRLAQTGSNRGLGPDVATTNGGIRYEVVPVSGQSVLSCRIKTATNGGTIDIIFVGPDFEPDQGNIAFASLVGTKYTTGNPAQVAVVAGTEAIIQAICLGDGYAIIKFTGSVGAGAITYCDVAMADAPVINTATVTLNTGDVEIGAVELKNGTDDTRAKIGAGTALVSSDNALAVKDVGIPAAPTVVSAVDTASSADEVIADTGNLTAGSYRVEITMGHSGDPAVGKHLVAEHRNAADDTTLHTLGLCPSGGAMGVVLDRVVVASNESIRVKMGAVAAAGGEVAQAMIRVYALS